MGSASGVPALQVAREIDEAKETQTDREEVLLDSKKEKRHEWSEIIVESMTREPPKHQRSIDETKRNKGDLDSVGKIIIWTNDDFKEFK